MDAEPLDSFHLREFLKQLGKSPPAVKVQTVICRILSNYDKFLHTLGGKRPGLLHKGFHRNGFMSSADERYRAI